MDRVHSIACFIIGTLGIMATSCSGGRVIGNDNKTTAKPAVESSKKEDKKTIKPYDKIITDKAITQKGLITVHQENDKVYLELADSLLQTEMLLVTRISKSGWELRKEMAGYSGDPVGESVIYFEKGPGDRIFIREKSYRNFNSEDTTSGLHTVIQRNSVAQIAAVFPILAFTPDSTGYVIDVTAHIEGDKGLFSFENAQGKKAIGLGEFQADRSFINYVRSFPENLEFNTIRTYKKGDGAATVELNSSLVALPKNPMQPRFFDPRVGFIAMERTDYGAHSYAIKEKGLIKRWRLEPRPEDREAYYRGELVEPQKPIVFYIDPATPKQWIPYLIKGVNDWQVAFEQAGFKNAIIGKRAPSPEEDSTWSLLDARNSAIVYKPSETMNASGPSIIDPRTGEILESHINWYHNVMKLLHGWYFVQAGAVDPEARSMNFSDELMGELIRFVAAHEVGHTLGLQHNWTASSTVPVEKLRDRDWLRKNGHTPSIMDYARFNYVAQPGDGLGRYELFPHIGEYDRWAIEWGYRLWPGIANAEDEYHFLRKLTSDSLDKNPRLIYSDQMDNGGDPRTQNEDLGDDAIKASEYGIRNLKRIIPKLPEWTREPNADYSNLSEMFTWVTRQLELYYAHVTHNIGGRNQTLKTVDQNGSVYTFPPANKPREAMAFLDKHLFTTPHWLIEPALTRQTQLNPVNVIGNMQQKILDRLVGGKILALLNLEVLDSNISYTASEMLSDLRGIIFRELKSGAPIDIFRRNLQRKFVDRLIYIAVKPPDKAVFSLEEIGAMFVRESEAVALVRGELRRIHQLITVSIPGQKDPATIDHLQYLADNIGETLQLKH